MNHVSRSPQKKRHSVLIRTAGFAAISCLNGLMRTLEIKAAYYDPRVDPAYPEGDRPRIYVFWHENLGLPIFLRKHSKMAALLSRHRDADVLEQLVLSLGFECVRGSTARGGIEAIRELLKKGTRVHLAITPDGPRGPRRSFTPGAIFLASRLQMPIVPLGFGFDKPFRFNSWDRFALPRPWSRARVLAGPEIYVPPHLPRHDVEHFRVRVEAFLNYLSDEAESWACSGHTIENESMVQDGPKYSLLYYAYPQKASICDQ